MVDEAVLDDTIHMPDGLKGLEDDTLRMYPGRFLRSTVALTLDELAHAAARHLAEMADQHGCEASSRRAGFEGQLNALRDVWVALDLPYLAEMWEHLGYDPAEQAPGDQAVAEAGTTGPDADAEEHGGNDQQNERQSFHAGGVPAAQIG